MSGYLNYVGADLPEPEAQEEQPKPVRRKVAPPKEK